MSEKEKHVRRAFVSDSRFVAELVYDGESTAFAVLDHATGAIELKPGVELASGKVLPLAAEDPAVRSVRLPSACDAERSDAPAIIEDIRAFVRRWVDLEPRYEKLAAWFVLLTWCYDEFYEVPYLRITADMGSGKSRCGVDVLGALCYKAVPTIAASSISSLFRLCDTIKGTIILDEADLDDQSEKTSDLTQMLNAGYKRGIPIYRVSQAGKNGAFTAESYDVFGPKIIISRERMKDVALESRCLTISLRSTRRKDLPLTLDATLEREALGLRNRLLAWRLIGWGSRAGAMDREILETDIEPRLKQLLLVMSTIVGPAGREQLLEFAGEAASAAEADRSNSFAGEILAAVRDILQLRGSGEEVFLGLGDIADQVNESRGANGKRISANGVGRTLRNDLALRTDRDASHSFRGLACKLEHLNQTFVRYGLPELEAKEQARIEDLKF